MKQIKSLFIGICVSGVLLFVPVLGFGQVAVEPSYEVSLQLLTGSNDSGAKGNTPSNLVAIGQQIKANYGTSSYRVVGTFLGRTASAGNFNSKSSLSLGTLIPGQSQSILEWNIVNLKSETSVKGPTIRLASLSVQARVPFSMPNGKDDSGKDRSSVIYENFGLNLNKVSVQDNVPALIGTLNLSGTNDPVFVVITIKPVDL